MIEQLPNFSPQYSRMEHKPGMGVSGPGVSKITLNYHKFKASLDYIRLYLKKTNNNNNHKTKINKTEERKEGFGTLL